MPIADGFWPESETVAVLTPVTLSLGREIETVRARRARALQAALSSPQPLVDYSVGRDDTASEISR